MRVASFFAGIGGIDLGLERVGMQTVFQCEWNPYCQKVLQKHWPEVPKHGDIHTLTADAIPPAELWAGGFPCQPFSKSGHRRANEDERHLWPIWFSLIREARPRYVLQENVPGLLSANGGRVFGALLRDLASAGFDAEWCVLSARDVGAPHSRERVFVIAYHRSERVPRHQSQTISWQPEFSWWQDVRRVEDLRGRSDLPEPLIRGNRDGIPDWMDRLKALGNAVVPQVASLMGLRLLEIDRWLNE